MATSSNDAQRGERLARILFLLLLGCVAFGVFGPGGDDDAHITYTAAKNLAESGAITNNNGEAVEQGSSLLHVVLLGYTYKLASLVVSQVDMAATGPLFSLFFAALCLPLSMSLARRLQVANVLPVGLLLSLSTGFGYWALGGLEATLAAACVLYYLFAVERFIRTHQPHYFDGHLFWATLLFLLVRPESFLVLAAFLGLFAALLVLQKKQAMLNRIAIMGGYALLFTLVIGGWRLLEFGQWFPQPVYAKAEGFSPVKIAIGLWYFIYSAQPSIILYTLALWGIWRQRQHVSPHILAAFAFCLAHIAFIITSGGDWMFGGRFFVPILPVLVVLALYTLQHHIHYRKIVLAIAALCCLEIGGFALKMATALPFWQADTFRQQHDNINWRGYPWSETDNLVHARDIPVIEALGTIIEALPPQVEPFTIASIQMGMVPHHLRNRYGDKVYVVDLRGLTTQHLDQCPALASAPKTFSGIAIRYQDYFNALDSCHLPRPDIIYDLLNREPEVNAERLQSIINRGYTIVYRQQGHLVPAPGLKQFDTDTFIAVSPTLYSALPEELRDRKVVFGKH